MNSPEVAHLVERIVATWPAGPRGLIWTEALGALDRDTAQRVYVHLRDNDEKPPSVARFIGVYRSHTGANLPTTTTLDYGDEPISLDEYLQRLARRATAGDLEAADELERRQRWRGHRALTPPGARDEQPPTSTPEPSRQRRERLT